MDPNIKQAAQKELLRRKARAELERRRAAQPSVGMDMAKGFGAGVTQGTLGLAGMMGDARDLAKRGFEYFGGDGQSFEQAPGEMMHGPAGLAMRMISGAPTTEKLTQATESVTGPMYEAQTIPGQYAQTAGQFAPAALAGPGGAVRKTAMALIPAASSETAGQLTKDTAAEPYARLAGAIGGGVLAAGRGGNAMKEMRRNADDLATVGAKTNAAYAKLRDAGIQFDENAYKSFAMKVAVKLREHGWRPRDGDPITSDLREIAKRIGKPNDWAEMENLRQYVGNLPTNASPKDFARAGIIKDALSDFIDNGKVISTKGLDPKSIAALTSEARELGRKNIIGKKIAKMTDKSKWYLGGEESGLRNQVSAFGKKQGKSLTAAEDAAFKKVVAREGILSALNSTGSRLGQIVMGGLGFAGGGPLGGVGAMGAHYAARKGSEVLTKKALRDALATVLAGRPAQKAAMGLDSLTAKEIMARRLLAGGAGQSSVASH